MEISLKKIIVYDKIVKNCNANIVLWGQIKLKVSLKIISIKKDNFFAFI